MKSYDSRVYSINDFVEWDKQGHLELNPFFQRRSVWSENAKSYLVDTILRGKPIPKIFIRQNLNVTTKIANREVVDGQQRVRTILSYVKDGFSVSRRHNQDSGGRRFSQLSEEIKSQILTYELSVDLLINMPDSEVLDIFGRLNSYAVTLNEQEKINANHFGPFKILADNIGRKYADYWKDQNVLTARQILRMLEVNLTADLLIAMQEGIKSKKQIKRFYDSYERDYDEDIAAIEARFDETISTIARIYPEGISTAEFRRPHLFYSLFISVAHCLFGIPNLGVETYTLFGTHDLQNARHGLDRVGEMFASDIKMLDDDEQQFIQDSRRATTDETVRKRRSQFLVKLIGG